MKPKDPKSERHWTDDITEVNQGAWQLRLPLLIAIVAATFATLAYLAKIQAPLEVHVLVAGLGVIFALARFHAQNTT